LLVAVGLVWRCKKKNQAQVRGRENSALDANQEKSSQTNQPTKEEEGKKKKRKPTKERMETPVSIDPHMKDEVPRFSESEMTPLVKDIYFLCSVGKSSNTSKPPPKPPMLEENMPDDESDAVRSIESYKNLLDEYVLRCLEELLAKDSNINWADTQGKVPGFFVMNSQMFPFLFFCFHLAFVSFRFGHFSLLIFLSFRPVQE
jgi:hypothetical protein